jgi:hypothetical protein
MGRLVWLLLIASAALNVTLLLRRPAPAPASASAPAPDPSRRDPAPPPPSPSSARPPIAFGAVAPTRAPAAAPPRPSLAEVGPAEQRDALCEIARDQLRRRWLDERDRITRSLMDSLRDPAGQEADTQKDLERFSSLLDLRPPARDAFADRYRRARTARVDVALAALDRAPPDYGAVLGAARGLFSDEDRLAREFGGDNGAQLIRAAELDSRTTFLALLGAFAGTPWDSSITW